MKYFENEKNENTGITNLFLWHFKIIKQYIWLIIITTIIGLVAGIVVQRNTEDTYFKEVLLQSSDNQHLNITNELLAQNRNNTRTINITNLTFENLDFQQLYIGGFTNSFRALNKNIDMDVVKLVATSSATKIKVMESLSTESTIAQKVAEKKLTAENFTGQFKISNLKRGSKNILLRYDGWSIDEADIAIDAMLSTLRNIFGKQEKKRIVAAFETRLLIIDTQIAAIESALKTTNSANPVTAAGVDEAQPPQQYPDLAALKLDRKNVVEFNVDNIDIQPFVVVFVEQRKNTGATDRFTWLILTTFAGLFLGIILAYLLHGIRRLKNI